MAALPDRWLDELFARIDIADVVSQYVSLSRKGGRLWGCCPFHSEKTPSFSVSPDKGLYYCFGCHAGGNAVHFVMQMEHLNFYEACQSLAERAGMDMPERVDDEKLKKDRALKERLTAACREAAHWYFRNLGSDKGRAAMAYLSKRGLTGNVISAFGLGYSPNSWEELFTYLTGKGFSAEELVAANLALSKNGNSYYDTFRNRVMFPIINQYGQVIGFGARAMGDEKPKYLNTGDTPVFNKRYNLYALNMQKGVHPADLIVVEGYMDVVGLRQYGVENAVASLGTALTQQQARLLKRVVNDVYLAYDGDSAGQNATLRGIGVLQAEGLNVSVITIPGGDDPDEYVRKNGREAFDELKKSALPVPAYRLSRIYAEHDLNNPDARQDCAAEACKYLATLSPIQQDRYSMEVSRQTGFPVDTLKRQIAQIQGNPEPERNMPANYRHTKTELADSPSPRMVKEMLLLKLAAAYPELIDSMDSNLLSTETHRRIFSAIVTHRGQSESVIISELDENTAACALKAFEIPDSDDPRASLNEALTALMIMNLEDERTRLHSEPSPGIETMKRIRELNTNINELKRKGSGV